MPGSSATTIIAAMCKKFRIPVSRKRETSIVVIFSDYAVLYHFLLDVAFMGVFYQ